MTFKYNVVSELQNYMFSKIIEMPIPQPQLVPLPVPPVVPPIMLNAQSAPKVEPFFSPRVNDQLFWCFYVMKNGLVAYEMDPPTFVKEKEEKIKYVLLLRNNKELLKKFKLGKDIETNLSLDKTISVSTFFALCALENINAVVLHSQLYSDICVNSTTNTMFVLNKRKHKFTLILEQSPISELKYETTHFKLPLKSISAYKLCDLQNICARLKIQVPLECKKKQSLYTLISDALNKID